MYFIFKYGIFQPVTTPEQGPIRHLPQNEGIVSPGRDIFCDIVEHNAAAVRIFETDSAAVIMDTKGYPLVLSKTHERSSIPDILSLAGKMIGAVEKAYGVNAVRIQLNFGEAAGQEILHPHVHVMPRVQVEHGVGRTVTIENEELKSKMAKRIRTLCKPLTPYPYKKPV